MGFENMNESDMFGVSASVPGFRLYLRFVLLVL